MKERLHKMLTRAAKLINNGRAAASIIAADAELRREIDALYRHYTGRGVTGCKNCYVDALIHLKSISNKNMTDKFILKRGKVLKDTVNNNARLNLVRGNETDELALYHLSTNPAAIHAFDRVPGDAELSEMIKKFVEAGGLPKPARVQIADAKAEAELIVADAKAEAELIVADAKAEAELIVADAKAEAELIVADAKAEAEKIKAAKKPAKKVALSPTASDPLLE